MMAGGDKSRASVVQVKPCSASSADARPQAGRSPCRMPMMMLGKHPSVACPVVFFANYRCAWIGLP